MGTLKLDDCSFFFRNALTDEATVSVTRRDGLRCLEVEAEHKHYRFRLETRRGKASAASTKTPLVLETSIGNGRLLLYLRLTRDDPWYLEKDAARAELIVVPNTERDLVNLNNRLSEIRDGAGADVDSPLATRGRGSKRRDRMKPRLSAARTGATHERGSMLVLVGLFDPTTGSWMTGCGCCGCGWLVVGGCGWLVGGGGGVGVHIDA